MECYKIDLFEKPDDDRSLRDALIDETREMLKIENANPQPSDNAEHCPYERLTVLYSCPYTSKPRRKCTTNSSIVDFLHILYTRSTTKWQIVFLHKKSSQTSLRLPAWGQ